MKLYRSLKNFILKNIDFSKKLFEYHNDINVNDTVFIKNITILAKDKKYLIIRIR